MYLAMVAKGSLDAAQLRDAHMTSTIEETQKDFAVTLESDRNVLDIEAHPRVDQSRNLELLAMAYGKKVLDQRSTDELLATLLFAQAHPLRRNEATILSSGDYFVMIHARIWKDSDYLIFSYPGCTGRGFRYYWKTGTVTDERAGCP